MVGQQPYSRAHSARDSVVMAVLAFGEGYHNYHHSFPFDYRNGIKRWHFDPAKWLIWALSHVGLTRELRRAPEAAILKAKIEIQFETAKERMQRVVAHSREGYEERLHQAYARLETAIHELVALQRRRSGKPAGEGEHHLPLEARLGMTYNALEQALREWKRTLRQMKRLPVASAA
jgi:stearoyl-CoA desaturase (delta-9 desaturase)